MYLHIKLTSQLTTFLFYSRHDKQCELEHGMPLLAYREPSRPNVTESSDESDSESESHPWSYLKK